MTKYSIITGISALLLALIVPVECMGSGQQEEATCLAAFQNDLKEEVYQTGIAFLGYIGEGVPVQDILDYTKQADYLEGLSVSSKRNGCRCWWYEVLRYCSRFRLVH